LPAYCWSLIKEIPTGEFKRWKKKNWVFNDEFVCG
jgi:hypothetical protein